MDFCDVPLPAIVADLVRPPFMKEVFNRAEVLVCDRVHQTLLNAVFMARLDPVLMEEKASGDFRHGESLVRFVCIWRCYNKLDRPKERGNIVKWLINGFYALRNAEIPCNFGIPA